MQVYGIEEARVAARRLRLHGGSSLMAELTKTWTFDSDLEGAAIGSAGLLEPVWYDSDGDISPGCIRFEQASADLAGITA